MKDEFQKFKDYVYKYDLGACLENMSFKNLTTLVIGGTCRIFYMPADLDTLITAYHYIIEHQLPYLVIGNGSNMLVNDRAIPIIVISLKNLNDVTKIDDVTYRVAAGIKAPVLAGRMAEEGLTNGEFMSVIPGTIGGLTYMNAGAYKKCMADIVSSITYIDDNGCLKTIDNTNNQLHFSYRHSIFKEITGIIIYVTIKLEKAEHIDDPLNKIKKYLQTKKETQPLTRGNAGSTFKNNGNDSTWKIIDYLGYRGYRIGGAKVSEKHANFLVNENEATFQEMESLITEIQRSAKEKLNIELECEWEIIR